MNANNGRIRKLSRRGVRIFGRRRGKKGDQKRSVFLRWTLILSVIVLLSLLLPRERTYEFSKFREGMPSREEIIADFDFRVYKNDEELRREKEQARKNVLPLLKYNGKLVAQKVAALDSLFERAAGAAKGGASNPLKIQEVRRGLPIFDETIGFLLEKARGEDRKDFDRLRENCKTILTDVYALGVLSDSDRRSIDGESPGIVNISRNGREENLPVDEVLDLSAANEMISESLKRSFPQDETIKVCKEVVAAFLSPNLSFDRETTEARRGEVVREVALIKGFVSKGEKIIGAGERVTADHIDKLNSYARRKRELSDNPWEGHLLLLEQILISAFLVLVFIKYLHIFEKGIYESNSFLLLLAIILVTPVVMASYANSHPGLSPFLVPVALFSMLAAVLFNAQVGLVLTFVMAFIVGAVFDYDFQVTLVSALCGAVAVYSVRRVRHRRQFYRSMIYIPLSYAVAIVATDVLRFTSFDFERISHDAGPGMLIGLLSPILTMGLLPIFESVFNITTDITLLELSDLNQPLLRDLAIRAPGTYSHSIAMANLSEAAAEAIGADPLLARVGCYYHDIGKMVRPGHFIENIEMGARNPHDRLTPSMSALIIASHVKDGIEIAEEHGLPKAIRDIIPQHHGTSIMAPFYNKALERGDKEDVQKESFRYPGPKPQTKVVGIINLADAVESAVRSMKERTPSRVKGMIKTIIQGRFSSSELDECELTLKDLDKIGKSFLPVLMGTMHERVEYPWQKVPT